MPTPIDPRVAKLLGDLLALALSENASQGEAAIGAIRRRAARDGVTAGALKQLVDQLLAQPAPEQISYLRFTIQDQHRELDQLRALRRKAETALEHSQAANESLAVSIGRLHQMRRTGWIGGSLLGLGAGLLCLAATLLALRADRPAAGFDRVNRATLNDYLRSCFLSSSNSLGGHEFAAHLLIDVDDDGRIAHAQLAADQAAQLADAGHRAYAEMLLRTFSGGSCGVLPLPPSLRGKAGRIDLVLSR